MLRRDLLLLPILGTGSLGAWAQHPNETTGRVLQLEWVAGDLPPFAWRSTSGPRGYGHELVLLMAQQIGRSTQVSYYPWARAVQLTERSTNIGIFPLARTPDREKRFQWLVPLLTVRYALVTLATDRRMGVSDMRSRRVGVLRGSPIVRN
ncbi:MAG: transporter substrate-binding domain-containing protein, partial [Rubrivivax sp.]